MRELEKMIDSMPLRIDKNIDPRIQKLLQKILKKNSWERLSCQQILNDTNFKSLIKQFNLYNNVTNKEKKNIITK